MLAARFISGRVVSEGHVAGNGFILGSLRITGLHMLETETGWPDLGNPRTTIYSQNAPKPHDWMDCDCASPECTDSQPHRVPVALAAG